MIELINLQRGDWEVLGFLDDNTDNHGKMINGYPVLGGIEWIKSYDADGPLSIALGVGSPVVKQKIAGNLQGLNVCFPTLIAPDVIMSKQVSIGQGTIICSRNVLTCNIVIGDFVTINLSSTIGHDVVIEDYVTILPGCNISGNVVLRELADVGTNTAIIQGIEVGRSTIVGAGSTVIRDLPEKCTAVGSPAKPIKFHEER